MTTDRICSECPTSLRGRPSWALTCGHRCLHIRTNRLARERRRPQPRQCTECRALVTKRRSDALTCGAACANRRNVRITREQRERRSTNRKPEPLSDALHRLAASLLAGDDTSAARAHADTGVALAKDALADGPSEALRWIIGLLP